MDGHKEIAELLISEEVDMNAKDQDGLGSLHYSARAVHKEIVDLLINNGADVNVRSTANLTPLDLSSGKVADLIRKQGGKTSKELIALSKAARTGNIAEVKKHLATGADMNAKDMYGDTPLHDAVKRGHREVVELLITNGAGYEYAGWKWPDSLVSRDSFRSQGNRRNTHCQGCVCECKG